VERLRNNIEAKRNETWMLARKQSPDQGSIGMIPRATHETLVPLTTMRFNQEMIEHSKRNGLHA